MRVFALYNMQWCCRARSYTVFHSSMTYIRAVNRSVNIGSELKLGARARTYQRPATPYRRVTGHPTTPSVPGEHGPTRPCPLRAAHGTHRAPRAAARTHPRDGARGRRKHAAARRPCTLRPAAGASPARGPCWSTRQGRRRRLARPGGALQQPRWAGRPPRWLPRQRSAAALRQPRGSLSACGERQTGSHASGEV